MSARLPCPNNMCDIISTSLSNSDFFQSECYGIVWDGPTQDVHPADQNTVEVPPTNNPLAQDDFMLLQATIDPKQSREEYGVDIYLNVLSFIEQHLH